MLKNKICLTILVIFLSGFVVFGATAEWKFLGLKIVDDKVDRDEISVGARKGEFKAIKLKVRRSGVNFLAVNIHYGNGRIQKVKMRNYIPAGGETRSIDLPGNNRIIRKVVFYYRTERNRKRRALVRLYGLRR